MCRFNGFLVLQAPLHGWVTHICYVGRNQSVVQLVIKLKAYNQSLVRWLPSEGMCWSVVAHIILYSGLVKVTVCTWGHDVCKVTEVSDAHIQTHSIIKFFFSFTNVSI